MQRLTCVPLYLFPDKCLTFSRCQLLPGVTLTRLSLAQKLLACIDRALVEL